MTIVILNRAKHFFSESGSALNIMTLAQRFSFERKFIRATNSRKKG